MTDYLLSNMWQAWLVVAVVCLIVELSSGDFFFVCFAIGALSAAVAALVDANGYWQVAVFALCTTVSIFTVRPVALRYLHRNDPHRASNADALTGAKGRVTEPIKGTGTGYVQIAGDHWRAVSATGSDIAAGTIVRVVSRESTIVSVEEA